MTKSGVIRICTASDQLKLIGPAHKSVAIFNPLERINRKSTRVRCVTLLLLSVVDGKVMGNFCTMHWSVFSYRQVTNRRSFDMVLSLVPEDPRKLALGGRGLSYYSPNHLRRQAAFQNDGDINIF